MDCPDELQREFWLDHNEERTKDDTISLYDKWASQYDKVLSSKSQYHLISDYAASALEKYMTVPDAKVLDVACGTGLTGLALLKCGFTDIDGLDPSNEMLLQAKKKSIYKKLMQGIITDTEVLDVPDNSYDAIIVVGAMSKDQLLPRNGFKEFFRIIKPGGYCVCTVADPRNAFGFMEIIGQGMKDSICQLISIEERFYTYNVVKEINRTCLVCVLKML